MDEMEPDRVAVHKRIHRETYLILKEATLRGGNRLTLAAFHKMVGAVFSHLVGRNSFNRLRTMDVKKSIAQLQRYWMLRQGGRLAASPARQ
jgi:hypothetical protein